MSADKPDLTPLPWTVRESERRIEDDNGIGVLWPADGAGDYYQSIQLLHRVARAVNAHDHHLALIAALTEALAWALPLAEIELENHRQRRLQHGQNRDIGAGTDQLGLWPREQKQRAQARAALKLAKESGNG